MVRRKEINKLGFKSDPDIVGKIISAQLSEDYLAALLRQQEKEVVR